MIKNREQWFAQAGSINLLFKICTDTCDHSSTIINNPRPASWAAPYKWLFRWVTWQKMTVIWYLLPGLFLLPQIYDFPPFHTRIQTLGGLWYPLQCRKFRELRGDAGVAKKNQTTVDNIHQNVWLKSIIISPSPLSLDPNTFWYENPLISELLKPLFCSKSNQIWLAFVGWLKASTDDFSRYL